MRIANRIEVARKTELCNFLLISLCLIFSLASPGHSATPPHSVLEELALTSHDSKEQELLDDVKNSRALHGEDSAIAFERLCELAKYYADADLQDRLTAMAPELQQKFAKLQLSDQQYFAVQLLQAADKAVSARRPNAAAALYLPVIESGRNVKWQNSAEVSALLSNLARSLQAQQRSMEAQKVLSTATRLQGKTDTAIDPTSLRQSADLHFKLKMYDKAAADLEQLVGAEEMESHLDDLRLLLQTYAEAGNKEKLRKLFPKVEKLCRMPQDRRNLSKLEQAITAYGKCDLLAEVKELYIALIAGMQAGHVEISYQTSTFGSILQRVYVRVHEDEACTAFKTFSQMTKSCYGGSSIEWMEVMSRRLTACQQVRPQQAEAYAELDGDIELGDSKQKLAYLAVLMKGDQEQLTRVSAKVAAILKDPATGPDAIKLYLQASRYYSSVQMPDKAEDCDKKVIAALCDEVNPSDQWLKPYITKLEPSQDDRRSGNFDRFVTSFLSEYKHPHLNRSLEDLVYSELARQNRQKDLLSLVEERLLKLGSMDTNRSTLENAMRKYVMVLERKKGVIPQRAKEPDLLLVKQAHCLFLKGAVQSKWRKPTNGSGTTKIAFQMDREGIKNAHIVASSANKKNDESALKSIVEMSDLDAVLPGFTDMTFDVTFDQQTGDITVS